MTQKIDVSITPQSYLPEIRASEGDNTLRVITVTVLDDEGAPYEPSEGITATFAGTKPSGLGFTLPCDIEEDGKVSFTLASTATNEVGRFPAEIRFMDGEARIGTCNLMMNIEPNPHPDDTTDGDREPLVNEITALLEEITEQADRAEEAAEKAEQAAASAGYMFFYIDDSGHLIYQRTSNTEVDFYLQNGHLFVEAAA